MNALAAGVLNGDRRAVARLLTLIENQAEQARQALAEIYPRTGRAHVVGITGAPGTGKSTLANSIALEFRRRGWSVGILAIDPSSPFSGGAILGDRVRMQEAAADAGVFIRSMAARGALGGLCRAAADAIHVLDAFGRDVIMVETVGVGQDEIDIASAAHTTVVLQMPTLGDDIQALKAGILEIADVLVINKADLPGAERVEAALSLMLDLDGRSTGWRAPVLQTVASENSGIAALVEALGQHLAYLKSGQFLARRELRRVHSHILALLRDELSARALAALPAGRLDQVVEQVAQRWLDPYTAVQRLVASV